MNFYRNKKILITGGSKGIGKEIVEMLLRSNAKVYSISRTTSGIKNVRFTEILMDLTDIKTKSLDLLKDWKEIEFDVLINNVGSNPGMKKFEEHSMEDIEKHLFLNVTVNLFTMKLFKFKKVVFINSVLSMTGVPLNSIYCASKSFIFTLNESLRREGVDTLIICPYKVNTELFSEVNDFMVQDKKNVALEVVTGIEANSKTKYLPSIMRIYPFIDSIIPVCLLDRLVNWIFSKIVKPKND